MGLAASAQVIAAGTVWRLAGLSPAGRLLVNAVTTGDENEQTLAGILLVRAGDRSVPLVTHAIEDDASAAELVDVLASIGTDAARTALERLAATPPSDIAASAEQALRDLEEIRRYID